MTGRAGIAVAMQAPDVQIIPSDMLLLAYRSGIFPMSDDRDDPEIFWVEPKDRAIFPLDSFHCSRSLAKTLRRGTFTVTCNTAFAEIMEACAAPRTGHPDSWISHRIAASYQALHQAGHAHSLECWQDGKLIGGLYGVMIGRAFCGESMFSRQRDASKVALSWLVVLMRKAGGQLLDCQFMTAHLASMGAVEISQADYIELLEKACANGEPADLPAAYCALLQEAENEPSSPGKLIAQSLTQTS